MGIVSVNEILVITGMRSQKIHIFLLSLSLTTAAISFTVTPATSQTQVPPTSPTPSSSRSSTPIKIERQPIAASRLYQGMTRAEVEKVMGKPTDTKVLPNLDLNLEILNYRQQPIVTKVSMIDGRLSGVTTELTTITNDNLPRFIQGIKIGMSREEVLKLMGKPFSERRNDLSTTKYEQLVYVKNGEPAVNVILVDDRVEGINTGLETPSQILKVILPAAPTLPMQGAAYQRIRIGMSPQQAISIYGQPTFIQPLDYKQQKVINFVYAKLNTNASTRFTFINDVLTRYSFIPQSNMYHSK